MGRKRHIIPYEMQGQHRSSLHTSVKLFPNNDRAPLAPSTPAGLDENTIKKKKNPAGVQTFSGSVLQINRNLTNFFTLSAVNLRPPPSTLSTHTQERGRTSKI